MWNPHITEGGKAVKKSWYKETYPSYEDRPSFLNRLPKVTLLNTDGLGAKSKGNLGGDITLKAIALPEISL